jgi:cytochrome c oxidase subunit 3
MSVTPQAMQQAVREPWHSLHRQREAVSFGVWIFLGSEMMFFGGALMLYAAYRFLYSGGFEAAGRETNIWFGTANTAILLTSSLTMAVAAEAAEAGLRRLTLRCLAATAGLGLAFLVVKGFEYRQDIVEHLLPGTAFRGGDPAAEIFFALYWLLTAVHAVHLTIGISAVTFLGWQAWRGHRSLASPAFEGVALYWHLVDIVWVFLYPLLYLPGRSS